MNNPTAFDQIFKDSLENLEVPYDASTWQSFAQKLDGLPEQSGDDELLPFDAPFATALTGIEAPADPFAWDIFSKKLDAAFPDPSETMPGDAQFRQILGNVEAPFQMAHWERMRGEIQVAEQRKRRILYMKLAEAAVFLLLFANLALYFVNQQPNNSKDSGSQAVAGKLKTPATQSGVAISSPKNTTGANARINPANVTNDAPSTATPVENMKGNFASALLPNAAALEPLAGINVVPENVGATAQPAQTSIEGNDVYKAQAILSAVALLQTPARSGLSIPPAAIPALNNVAVPVKTSTTSAWYVSNFASTDDNTTVSEGKTSRRRGFSAGIGLGFRRGKWGVEGGMAYSEKSYEPKRVLEIYSGNLSDGYFGSYNKEVSGEFLSVPLRLTRQLAEGRRLSVQALAGLSMNFALSKAYEYKTQYFPGLAPSTQPNPSATPQLRREGKGILEGGGLDGNVYATADVGLRGLVKLNRQFSIFVEPSYRRAISKQGIGERPAQTHSLAICAGVMAAM